MEILRKKSNFEPKIGLKKSDFEQKVQQKKTSTISPKILNSLFEKSLLVVLLMVLDASGYRNFTWFGNFYLNPLFRSFISILDLDPRS